MNIKKVWVAWTNSDLTEGKGKSFPLVVCDKKSTAIRLGSRGGVMESDCVVTEESAVEFPNGRWLIPGRIISASIEDDKQEAISDKREAAIIKCRDAGISEDEIKAITG